MVDGPIKKIASLMLLTFLLLPSSIVMAQSGQQKRLVIIDAAHGGTDGGVIITDKIREKEVTLALSLMLQKDLAKIPGMQVTLIRNSDKTMSTAERVKILKTMPAESLFISLHVNAGFGKNASGYEIYFPGFKSTPDDMGDSKAILKDMANNKYLNNSVRLAQVIQKNMEYVFPRKGRGLREAPVPVLNSLTLTGVILEVGFATNPDDRKIITNEKSQRDIVQALSRSINDFF